MILIQSQVFLIFNNKRYEFYKYLIHCKDFVSRFWVVLLCLYNDFSCEVDKRLMFPGCKNNSYLYAYCKREDECLRPCLFA